MKESQKRFLGAMLATSSVLGVVAPSVTAMASVKDETKSDIHELRDVINENLPKLKKDPKFSTFHKILYAADRLRIYHNLGYEADRVMDEIGVYSKQVHKPEIISVIDKMNNFSETKKMQMYDDLLEKDIPALTKIDADAAQYLTERLDSWGTAVVFEADPNYAKATDAILKVTELRKDRNKKEALKQIDVAKEAIKDMKTYKENGDYLNAKLKVEVDLVNKISNGGGGGGSSVGSRTRKINAVKEATTSQDLIKALNKLEIENVNKDNENNYWVADNVNFKDLKDKAAIQTKVNEINKQVEDANTKGDKEKEATEAVDKYVNMEITKLTLDNQKTYRDAADKATKLVNELNDGEKKTELQGKITNYTNKVNTIVNELEAEKVATEAKIKAVNEAGKDHEAMTEALSELEEFNHKVDPALQYNVVAEFIAIKGGKTYETIDQINEALQTAIDNVNETDKKVEAVKESEADNIVNALQDLLGKELVIDKNSSEYIERINEFNKAGNKKAISNLVKEINNIKAVNYANDNKTVEAALNTLGYEKFDKATEKGKIVAEFIKGRQLPDYVTKQYKTIEEIKVALQIAIDKVNAEAGIEAAFIEKINTTKDKTEMTTELGKLGNDEFDKANTTKNAIVTAFMDDRKAEKPYTTMQEIKDALQVAIDKINETDKKVEAVQKSEADNIVSVLQDLLGKELVIDKNSSEYIERINEFNKAANKTEIINLVKEINNIKSINDSNDSKTVSDVLSVLGYENFDKATEKGKIVAEFIKGRELPDYVTKQYKTIEEIEADLQIAIAEVDVVAYENASISIDNLNQDLKSVDNSKIVAEKSINSIKDADKKRELNEKIEKHSEAIEAKRKEIIKANLNTTNNVVMAEVVENIKTPEYGKLEDNLGENTSGVKKDVVAKVIELKKVNEPTDQEGLKTIINEAMKEVTVDYAKTGSKEDAHKVIGLAKSVDTELAKTIDSYKQQDILAEELSLTTPAKATVEAKNVVVLMAQAAQIETKNHDYKDFKQVSATIVQVVKLLTDSEKEVEDYLKMTIEKLTVDNMKDYEAQATTALGLVAQIKTEGKRTDLEKKLKPHQDEANTKVNELKVEAEKVSKATEEVNKYVEMDAKDLKLDNVNKYRAQATTASALVAKLKDDEIKTKLQDRIEDQDKKVEDKIKELQFVKSVNEINKGTENAKVVELLSTTGDAFKALVAGENEKYGKQSQIEVADLIIKDTKREELKNYKDVEDYISKKIDARKKLITGVNEAGNKSGDKATKLMNEALTNLKFKAFEDVTNVTTKDAIVADFIARMANGKEENTVYNTIKEITDALDKIIKEHVNAEVKDGAVGTKNVQGNTLVSMSIR